MNNYTIISVLALCSYLFLFLSFMAAKKTKVINGFLIVLITFIFWTGGSLFMRMEMWPNYRFWYNLSIFGLVFLPYGFYYFVHFLTESKNTKFLFIWLVVATTNGVINAVFDWYIPCPKLIVQANGQTAFIYDIGWPVAILFLCAGAMVLHMLVRMVKYSVDNSIAQRQMFPIFIGIAALFVGHVFTLVPFFAGFPIDVVSGIVNAVCMFYALYRKRLFRLTLLVSRGTCYAVAAAIAAVVFSYCIKPMTYFLENQVGIVSGNATLIIAIIFTLSTFLVYTIMKKFIDKVFIKDEMLQADNLKDFSLAVSKSLQVDEILDELVLVIQNTIAVNKVYVFIRDLKGDTYSMMRSNSPLDKTLIKLKLDNPAVKWLLKNDQCLMISDFKRTIDYKSMWEKEKTQFNDMGIECMVPLKDADDLIGIVMISGKNKGGGLSFSDISFLDSVESVASIAVKNSRLYAKAYEEARTDELTGLLNRKYFHLTIEEQFEKSKGKSLALIILNVDDFKLYNQLYGNKEGDKALAQIAQIIKATVGNSGYVARYSGKEFAIILPMYDTLAATNLAESIRRQILNLNKREKDYALKVLTVSGGVCAIPYSASNVKQLIEYADMAVYNAKRKGKNNILVYTTGGNADEMTVKQNTGFKEGVYSTYESTVYALTAAIDAKDHYTFNHSKNVAYYATELAKAYGLNYEMIEIIREAALLHDIGKIGINENILNKQGRLTDVEFEIMKSHVEQSISIIRHLPSLDYVIPAVIGHHERYDGRGYPRRIGGEDIPLSARILCIADSFDAMVSKRSYKEPYSIEYALEELKGNAGTQFDPELTYLFIRLLKEEKVTVRLNQNKSDDMHSIE